MPASATHFTGGRQDLRAPDLLGWRPEDIKVDFKPPVVYANPSAPVFRCLPEGEMLRLQALDAALKGRADDWIGYGCEGMGV